MHAQFHTNWIILDYGGSGTILNEAHVRDRPPFCGERDTGIIGISCVDLEMT